MTNNLDETFFYLLCSVVCICHWKSEHEREREWEKEKTKKRKRKSKIWHKYIGSMMVFSSTILRLWISKKGEKEMKTYDRENVSTKRVISHDTTTMMVMGKHWSSDAWMCWHVPTWKRSFWSNLLHTEKSVKWMKWNEFMTIKISLNFTSFTLSCKMKMY